MEIILLVITVLLLLFIAIQSIINKGKPFEGLSELENTLAGLQKSLTTLESNFKEDFRANRKEINDTARDNRDELNKAINRLTDNTIAQLEKITGKVELKLKELNDQSKTDNYAARDTLTKTFADFELSFEKNVKSFNDLQREKFNELGKKTG